MLANDCSIHQFRCITAASITYYLRLILCDFSSRTFFQFSPLTVDALKQIDCTMKKKAIW